MSSPGDRADGSVNVTFTPRPFGAAYNDVRGNNTLVVCASFGQEYLSGTTSIESTARFVKFNNELAIAIISINILMVLLSICGNTIVTLTIFLQSQLHKVPSNMLLANLALTDLLNNGLIQASYIYHLIQIATNPDNTCPLTIRIFIEILAFNIITASIANLCLITLDRYIAIVRSLRYHSIVTPLRTKAVIFVSWTFSTLFAVVHMMYRPVERLNIFWFLYLVIALVFMLSIHFKLYLISQKQSRKIAEQVRAITGQNTKTERRGMKSALIVTVVLGLSYLPLIARNVELSLNGKLVEGSTRQIVHDVFHQVNTTLFFLSSVLNPYLYFWRSRNLRKYAFKKYHVHLRQ